MVRRRVGERDEVDQRSSDEQGYPVGVLLMSQPVLQCIPENKC